MKRDMYNSWKETCTAHEKRRVLKTYALLHTTAMHCNTLQHAATRCNTLQLNLSRRRTPAYLSCVLLQRIATRCNTLQRTATHCNVYLWLGRAGGWCAVATPLSAANICWQHTATHCKSLWHSCNTLQYPYMYTCALVLQAFACRFDTAVCRLHWQNTLQHIAAHCNTLQHIATHCNTLQHTATYTYALGSQAVGVPLLHRCLPPTLTKHVATPCNTLNQHPSTYTCAVVSQAVGVPLLHRCLPPALTHLELNYSPVICLCVTWLINTCGMTHSYVTWHICVTRLICVPWLIHTYWCTLSSTTRRWFVCAWLNSFILFLMGTAALYRVCSTGLR